MTSLYRRRGRRAPTARMRLTLVFTTLLAAGTFVVAATVYLAMRYLPNYSSFSPIGVTSSTGGSSTGTPSVAVAVGQALTVHTQSDIFRTLLVILIVISCLVLALGAAASYWMAGRTLRPLRRINDAARIAATGSFAHRLQLPGPLDEITELGLTFDTMLDRLQDSFTAHQNFAANASHELQTPLATTKVILDVALGHPSSAHWPTVARQLREANERSIAIVDSLLDLTDIGNRPLPSAPMDLSALVTDIIEEHRPAADDRGLTIDYHSTPATVHGDPRLLRQLVTNLLSNAIRHNIAGGRVVVRITGGDAGAKLQVTNTGDVIPAAMVQRLVEPFVRIEPISADRDGHGLGLALCSTIVQAHHGTLALSAGADGGLHVAVFLPRNAAIAFAEDKEFG